MQPQSDYQNDKREAELHSILHLTSICHTLPIIKLPTKDDITRTTKLITAIFTLHNFPIDEEDLEDDEEDDIEVDRRDIV